MSQIGRVSGAPLARLGSSHHRNPDTWLWVFDFKLFLVGTVVTFLLFEGWYTKNKKQTKS